MGLFGGSSDKDSGSSLLKGSFEQGKKALSDLEDIITGGETVSQKNRKALKQLESEIGDEGVNELFSMLGSGKFDQAESFYEQNEISVEYGRVISVYLDEEANKGKKLMRKMGKQLKQTEGLLHQANNTPVEDSVHIRKVENAREQFEKMETGEFEQAQGHFERARRVAEYYDWQTDRFENEHEEAEDAIERVDDAEKKLEKYEAELS